jgi:hypothetical protein
MTIRNRVLLKRPWLWPVCAALGAACIFTQPNGLGIITEIAIYLGVVVTLNILFFVALRESGDGALILLI